MADRTPSWRRVLVIATLLVWALIFVVAWLGLANRNVNGTSRWNDWTPPWNDRSAIVAWLSLANRNFIGRTPQPVPGESAIRIFLKDKTVWWDVPALDAGPHEKRKTAYQTCATHGVKALAQIFPLKFFAALFPATPPSPTPEVVARIYARSVGWYREGEREAARPGPLSSSPFPRTPSYPLGVEEMRIMYEGCLRGFSPSLSSSPGFIREYSDEVARTCGLARAVLGRFGVPPTAEGAAVAYASKVPEGPWRDAAYEGCLRGLRGTRMFWTPQPYIVCMHYGDDSYLTCEGTKNPVTISLSQIGRPRVGHRPYTLNLGGPEEFTKLGIIQFVAGQEGLVREEFTKLGIIRFGRTWREGNFRCVSRRSGLTCSSTSGHGFSISRTRGFRVF